MPKTNKIKRPLLRYHGGKWNLAPWIISMMPHHKIYVEPYGGGGSVLLRKPKSKAEVYNDIDGRIVNLFKIVRDRGDELTKKLLLTPFSRQEFELSWERSEDPLEDARRTVVRSYMGFGSNALGGKNNSGFRCSAKSSNVAPSVSWINYPLSLGKIMDRLQGVMIENWDAFRVMKSNDSVDTLHYCDPPYIHSTRYTRRLSYTYEMSDEKHLELVKFLVNLNGKVMLSGYCNEIYSDVLKDWSYVRKRSLADGNKKRVEVLWLSPSCGERGLF